MGIFEEIENSSETIEQGKLNDLFLKALNELSISTLEERELSLEALYLLADKQWHNYRKLEPALLNKVDDHILDILQVDLSLQIVEYTSCIIGMLGLSKSYVWFKDLRNNPTLDKEILREVEDSIKEYGDSVEDPYKPAT